MKPGRYGPLIVAVLTVAVVVIETYAAHARWAPAVISAVGALAGWLVPGNGIRPFP